MIQVYADDGVLYDSRLDDRDILGLSVTLGLNKGGTAEIVLPPGHPYYDKLTSYRTIIAVYQDAKLLFRGRVLYLADDFTKLRTVTCEGERCFLRDAVSRPHLYRLPPDEIFAAVLADYNSQVEPVKQFRLGAVTVTDPNDYVRLESETAEAVLDTIDKLVERCGGYIVFTTAPDGARVANWYADLQYQSNQTIVFGENLLDYTSTGANTDLATAVYPYGARDNESGLRQTIASVNGGLEYIQDDEAVALRGRVAKAVFWDDVTTPEILLTKGRQYLAVSKQMVTSLQLSAYDLSQQDKSIDTFQVGDRVRVVSKPHQVDDYYLLTERAVDLLDPAGGSITLGKDRTTLTGADAAGDRESLGKIDAVEHNIRTDYTEGIASAVEQTKLTLTTLIQQTSEEIKLEVSETYTSNDQMSSAISTSMTQLANSFEFAFSQLLTTVETNDAEMREQLQLIERYIRFENGNIVLGEVGNEITLQLENDRLSFISNGAEVAYLTNEQLVITDANFLHSLRIGKFAFIPRANGNLSFTWIGGDA